MKALLFALLLLLAGSLYAQPTTVALAPGVSRQLAAARKAALGNIHYSLEVNIPANTQQPIQGHEVIFVDVNHVADDLYIDFEPANHVQAIAVNGQPATLNWQQEHLVVGRHLLTRGHNTIAIRFTAGETPLTRKPEYMYTLLVPEKARKFFPCFDQPDLKATFTLTATIPAQWEAVCNAPAIQTTLQDTLKTVRFDTSDKISTYLFSLVAGKFTKATRNMGNRQMHFYYRETDSVKIKASLDTIFGLHYHALQFLENYTGIAYPFKKFDFISLPDFPYGGMEHTGAIDYRETSLFLDQSATQREKLSRVQLIAHETAHMWFGNLVTMQWFNDVWMKEVFANFMADKVAEQAYPQTESRFTFMMEHHPAAYSVDRTAGANPIRQQLHNLNDAGSLYGSIIYHKAPIVMNQLELTVGRQRFQQALQQYLKTYAGSNANWPQLIAVLEKMGIANITQWNNNWINKSGRPLITYTLQQKGHNIQQLTVQQQDPQRGGRLWNQRFNIAFVYADSVHLLPVQLTGNKVVVTAAAGMPVPLQMVFNATGEGYGLFPVDTNMLNSTNPISSNVMRAAAYLNLYENVLDGHATTPAGLLQFYGKALLHEENDLLLSSISRQYKNIFWQFITPTARIKAGLQAEQDLAAAIDQAASPAKIRTLFKLYAAVALSPAAMQQLYSWWQQKQGPKNLSLNDDELTDLAAELALRNHPQAAALLDTQLARISNPDRKDRLRYLLPALSANVAVRNAFFATLSTNRTNQNYIATVLSYLHHPLRMPAGELYLQQSLQLLADVKAKGGVFFPTDWLANTFGLYQSTTAAQIVTGFLKAHPGYDPTLRLKILQETDDLFRSLRINGSK